MPQLSDAGLALSVRQNPTCRVTDVLKDQSRAPSERREHLRPQPRPRQGGWPALWASTPSGSALRADPPPPQPGFALGEELGVRLRLLRNHAVPVQGNGTAPSNPWRPICLRPWERRA